MHIFLSGLILFLTGLEGTKHFIKKLSNNKMKEIILSINDNILLLIFIGIIITSILQSSSAVSVILISLIEAGILNLKPAICIMLGANIGTTLTVQIISFPILSYYPFLILVGLVLILIGIFKGKKFIYLGCSFIFFSLVFAGLVIMTSYFKIPEVKNTLMHILLFSEKNLYSGILIGLITTAIIQSSSAVTGITVGLALNNMITLKSAIAVALGSNIGTCITAFLASINAGKAAKNMALAHFIFNITGVLILLPVFPIFEYIVLHTSSQLVRQIANAHTIFNIFNVLIFLPFLNTFISWIGGDSNGNA